MRAKTKKPSAREFLRGDHAMRTGQECHTCRHAAVKRDLLEWVAARAGGGVTTFNGFMERYLRVAYPDCPGESSLRRHVTHCMRRDLKSGLPLES